MSQPTGAGRRLRLVRGLNAGLLTLFVTGAIVLINLLAGRHPLRGDFSPDRRFRLAPQSIEALSRLSSPVDLYAFSLEGAPETEQIEDLLREYRIRSTRVRVHVVDPEKQPSLAQQFGIRTSGTVVVRLGDDERKIEFYNLFTPDAQGGMEFRGEQAITRALLELSGSGGRAFYFLQGHGEGSPSDAYSELRNHLEGEGFTVKSVNLAIENRVPKDAAVIVIAGPRSDLAPPEREMLEPFLREGGRLAVWLDPTAGRAFPELERLLRSVHVEGIPGIVVDPGRALFGDALSPVPELRWHDITQPLIQANAGVVFPGAQALRALDVPEGEAGSVQVVPLAVTTDRSWAESNPTGGEWRKEAADAAGPLDVAIAVSQAPKPALLAAAGASPGDGGPAGGGPPSGGVEAQGQASGQEPAGGGQAGAGDGAGEQEAMQPVAVVVGISAFAGNESFTFQGNRDFAVNQLVWLAGQRELVTIRPKVTSLPYVTLTAAQGAAVFYGATVGMPLVLLGAGIAVWWRRRSL